MSQYDVVVVGLGAMGSAALCQLARRGVRVLGIDQFAPPHDHGSSHGDTRITRLAIGEGIHYTPLVLRSHEIWREIEKLSGADLFTPCGELIVSSDEKTSFTHVANFFANTVEAARRHGIAHELLDAAQIRSRFPAFNVRNNEYGYFEPGAGYLRPERCIRAQLDLARGDGAEIRLSERMLAYEPDASGVTVTTAAGKYRAQQLVLAAGAWLPGLAEASLGRILRVYRQVLTWFAVEGDPSDFVPPRFPVFIWELPDTRQGIYGFPVVDDSGLKIASEQYDRTVAPDAVDRSVSEAEIAGTYNDFVAPNFHGVSARSLKTATCLYTVTPDAGFIIDRHPDSERVVIASCCSGHGFKHSAAVGEILAEMVQARRPAFDLKPLRIGRFS